MTLELVSLTPSQVLGIPVAIVGSVFLAIGAQLQHRGVADAAGAAGGGPGLGLGQALSLARNPWWVLGTVLLGLAVVIQLFSLILAPLTVVQPLGVIALVITSIVNARVSGVQLDGRSIRAIVFCVVGIGLFVSVAAITTSTRPIHGAQLVAVLAILAGVLLVLVVGFVLLRARFSAFFFILGAGVLFGFVATLAKVVIDRVHTLAAGGFRLAPDDWLTIVCVLALAGATVVGSYFVQSAYSSGPPDLVVAGLTVIDPLVGVTLGIVVLGEAADAPPWVAAAFVIAGALAVTGVVQLARHHPQNRVAVEPGFVLESAGQVGVLSSVLGTPTSNPEER